MICKYCGMLLEDDSAFCENCGRKIERDALSKEVASDERQQRNGSERFASKSQLKYECEEYECEEEFSGKHLSEEKRVKTHKRKKKFVVIGAVAAPIVILIIVGLYLFGGRLGIMSKITSNNTDGTEIIAEKTDDGIAYIPLLDGSCIAINNDVDTAAITKDREHVVVLLNDGTLYVTDKNQTTKIIIADDCDSIYRYNIRNEGFFYIDARENVYKVIFSDFSSHKLGNDIEFVVAPNSTSVLYATDSGDIYSMRSTETEAYKIGTYLDSVELEAISDDGEISVWVAENDDAQTIILNDGDDKVTLGNTGYEYNYTHVTFSKDQGLLVVESPYNDCIWIKYPGQEPIQVKLGAELRDNTIYTSKGCLSDAQSDDVPSLYISTVADIGTNVYNISMDGDRERLLSKVDNYCIADGYITYTDTEKNLYYAKLDEKNTVDGIKIASDVDMFELTKNGKYVYYMKDCDMDLGILYCYKIGEKEPVKIASEVACDDSWYWGEMCTTCSTNGSSVLFFKDMEEISETYTELGTLMLWSYKDKSTSKISSEVINYSVTSCLQSGDIDTSSFLFKKYSTLDDDDNIYVNLMQYNGTKVTELAADIIR